MQGTSAFLERVISTAREREQLTLQNFPRNQPISKFEVGQVKKKSRQHSILIFFNYPVLPIFHTSNQVNHCQNRFKQRKNASLRSTRP